MDKSRVASSYDVITQRHDGAGARGEDTAGAETEARVPFRHFNNHIKKFLIAQSLSVAGGFTSSSASSPTLNRSSPASPDSSNQRGRGRGGGWQRSPTLPQEPAVNAKVLELASGRGGDLSKWMYSNRVGRRTGAVVEALHGYDISPQCVAAAEARGAALREQAGDAEMGTIRFAVADCFTGEFWDTVSKLQENDAAVKFDIVSMQFALHYGCGSETSLRQFLKGVAGALVPGGVFMGTTVDAEELSTRFLAAARANSDTVVLENSLLRVSPCSDSLQALKDAVQGESPMSLPLGFHYDFQLHGHVNCDEFAVPFAVLCDEASRVGLDVVAPNNFSFGTKILSWLGDKSKLKQLGNDATLSEDERYLVTLYRSFFFVKRSDAESS
jgi:mRNA (guanine-N7-)-methyltransferase